MLGFCFCSSKKLIKRVNATSNVKGHLIANAQSDTRNNENDVLISYLINSYTYLKKMLSGRTTNVNSPFYSSWRHIGIVTAQTQ